MRSTRKFNFTEIRLFVGNMHQVVKRRQYRCFQVIKQDVKSRIYSQINYQIISHISFSICKKMELNDVLFHKVSKNWIPPSLSYDLVIEQYPIKQISTADNIKKDNICIIKSSFDNNMKKFEQHLRQKAHLNKIKNAKRTVPQPASKHSSRIGSQKGEEAQLLLRLYDNKSYDSIPAYKLLRTAGLQQYTRSFIERGYGINLGKLALINQKDRQKLYEDLKILPGHTVKLDNLINTLSEYTIDRDSNLFEQSQKYSEVSKESLAGRSVYSNKNAMKSGIRSKKSELADLQYEKQLERVLNQYTPVIQDKKKRTFNDRISEKNSINISARDSEKYAKTRYNPPISSKVGQQFKKKATTPLDSKPTIKRNTSIKGKTPNAKNSNPKTAETVSDKDKSKRNIDFGINQDHFKGLTTQKILEIDLGINKIKSLFRSFDGAYMSSTIVNIDIEELVYAFSGLIEKKVVAGQQPIIKKQLQLKLQDKPIPNNDNERYMQDSIEDQVGAILRQSYLHPLYRNSDENIDQQIENELNNKQEVDSEGQEQEQMNQENEFTNEKNMGQSSFLGGQSYDFGLQNTLDIFNEPNPSELDFFKPTIDSISNFIKNIVLAAKMQRQISIMAAYYLEAFLKKTNLPFTSLNYKRILVSVLLLASKIWDDESFQTPSFSRTFPEYNTTLLNQMQKEILKALDYRLKLDKKQYAQIFFRMRNFAKKHFRSCQNKRLNLKQIRELQVGIRKEYKFQFMEKRNSF